MLGARVVQRRLAQVSVAHLAHALDVPWTCLWLVETPERLRLASVWTRLGKQPLPRRIASAGLAGSVVSTGRVVTFADVSELTVEPLWRRSLLLEAAGLHAYAGAPIVYGGKTLGVLEAMRAAPKRFARRELGLLKEVAHLASLGMEVTRTLAAAERCMPQIVNTLTCAVGYAELLAELVVSPPQRAWAAQAHESAMEVVRLLQESQLLPPRDALPGSGSSELAQDDDDDHARPSRAS
jgi:transcriptional regulator with GAF, ATPase, and Fis domain